MIEDCPDLDIRETIQLVSLATLILLHIVRESLVFALFNIVKARVINFVENFWSTSTFPSFCNIMSNLIFLLGCVIFFAWLFKMDKPSLAKEY